MTAPGHASNANDCTAWPAGGDEQVLNPELSESENTGYSNLELEELRANVLHLVRWVLAGFAVVLLFSLVLPNGRALDAQYRTHILAVIAAIGFIAWSTSGLRSRFGVKWAALFLLSGLWVTMLSALPIDGFESVVFWFSLLVPLSGSLLGLPAMAATTTAVCITLISVAGPLAAAPPDLALGAGTFTLMLGLVSWLSTRPTYTALGWSWSNYRRSVQVTEQLRDRQLELNQALDRLRKANEHLEFVNRELARAREAAEEARNLKAQFAANVSHELRTPLNHIIGFAEVITTAPEVYGRPLPKAYREDVEAIYRSAKHLSRLIDDVLDLSQIDAARMGLVKEKVELAEIVHEAVGVVSGIYRGKRLDLRIEMPDTPIQLYVDRTRIRQIIINLLTNAARFTHQGGTTISCRIEDSQALVSVSDTGIGIAEQDLPKVFEEFRQLDGSIARRQEGSGLGLAICRRFVELHGGSIWVTSKVGVGSTFTFSLPLYSEESARRSSIPSRIIPRGFSSAARAEKTIGVIAEDPAFPRILQRYLDGCRVVTIADRQRGLDGNKRDLDAVVLTADSAAEAWRQLTAIQSQIGSIPAFACSVPKRRKLHGERSFAGRLVKPIDRSTLKAELERFGEHVRTILVIDDDPDTLRLLSRLIRSISRRYKVFTANSGQEGLSVMRIVRPDLLLLDLVMPEMDGHDVLQRIRRERRLRHIPIIAVTGRDDPEEAIVADAIVVARGGGLAAGEILPCLNASLNALLNLPGSERQPEEVRSG